MVFEKTWKSYQEQLDLLKSRNMSVVNDSNALSYLMQIGYYRLSAYWHPFRVFKLEIALRGSIAYVLGEKAPFAHQDPRHFHPKFAFKLNKSTGCARFDEWLNG